jgi:hypothetical protein
MTRSNGTRTGPTPVIHSTPPPPKRPRKSGGKGRPQTPAGRAASQLADEQWFVWDEAPKVWPSTVSRWRRMFAKPRLRGYLDVEGRVIVINGDPPKAGAGTPAPAAARGATAPKADPGAPGRASASAALGAARRKP